MTEKEILKNGFRLFFLLVLVFLIPAISSGFITYDRMNWYYSLPLSPLTPPQYVFGIVWSVLYILMAVSAFLVWGKASPRFFVLQLICNGLWTFVFFYLHAPLGGLVVTLVLLFFLALTIKEFYKASRKAAILLAPVFIWCLYAFYLNAYIVWHL